MSGSHRRLDQKYVGVKLLTRNNQFLSAAQIRLFLVIMGVSLIWLIFARAIVPPIIESAYQGTSWRVLNRMIQGQHINSIDYYLQKWDRLTVEMIVSLIGVWVVAVITSSPAFVRRI